MTRRRDLGFAGLVVLAILVAPRARAEGAAPNAGEAVIRIDNFTFSPAAVTVTVGTRITWKNDDDIPHTVVAEDASFRSRALDTGDTFTFVATKPGTVRYFCSLHPHMVATITVAAAAAAR